MSLLEGEWKEGSGADNRVAETPVGEDVRPDPAPAIKPSTEPANLAPITYTPVPQENDEASEALKLPGRGHGAKLSYKDVAQILQLEDSGKTQTDIAKLFGVSQGQISKIVNGFKDSRDLAKIRLYASASRLVDHALTASAVAASKGNAEPALELLDRTEVAAKRQPNANQGSKVMIVVGGLNQGQAALPDFSLVQLPAPEGQD